MDFEHLSPGEWILMKELWKKHPLTMNELLEAVSPETGWSKATVFVMLQRLEKKGKVRIFGTRNLHYYVPLIERKPVADNETASFLKRVYDGSFGMMVAAMADNKAISKRELAEIREILDKYENETKER